VVSGTTSSSSHAVVERAGAITPSLPSSNGRPLQYSNQW
jgi:hypothetical protein